MHFSDINFRYIKMSSPRLNNMIVLGCILLFCSGILNGIDGNFVGASMENLFGCTVQYKIDCVFLGSSVIFSESFPI